MRRDSIYYKIFQRFPELLFELVDKPPEQTQNYRFESIEVKETAFRIDGVFLPPEGTTPRIIFFAEVQFHSNLAPFSLSPNSRLEINFKADIQSTLKRTENVIQSDLSDLIYQPGNLFQGGCES